MFLHLSSASFLCASCDIQEQDVVYGSCLVSTVFGGKQKRRFLGGEKRRNSQKLSAKMSEKLSLFLHFFALIVNTDQYQARCKQWAQRQCLE